MQKIDDYLRIKEAADLLGVSTSTLRNWEKQGKLKVHRDPNSNYRLYKKSDLEKFLKSIETSAKR